MPTSEDAGRRQGPVGTTDVVQVSAGQTQTPPPSATPTPTPGPDEPTTTGTERGTAFSQPRFRRGRSVSSPTAGVRITYEPVNGGAATRVVTGVDGSYSVSLLPGTYVKRASRSRFVCRFGSPSGPGSGTEVVVVAGQSSTVDVFCIRRGLRQRR